MQARSRVVTLLAATTVVALAVATAAPAAAAVSAAAVSAKTASPDGVRSTRVQPTTATQKVDKGITAVRSCPMPTAPRTMACMAIRRTDIPSVAANALGPNVVPSGYGPSDLDSAYNLSGAGGSGATVAIVDAYNDPNAASDLAVYRTQFALSACTVASGCLQIVNQNGATSPLPANDFGWAGEEALDLDMVSAICPNCHIILVEANSAVSTDLYAAEDRAVAMGAKFVSNSWGGGEYSGETADDTHFNHPGVAIAVATGDGGTGASYPATSRYVTAVGGTSLSRPNPNARWIETAWSGAGSGCSAYETKPAWQSGSTTCARRAEADVSAVADWTHGVAVYQTYGAGGWGITGGTSAATPIIASVYALAGTPTAGTYPAAYPYLHAASNLFDIISGSNGGCGAPICTAGTGWDGPTGLGTPNGSGAFVPSSPPVANNPGTQTTAAGTSVSLTLTASGGSTPYTWTSTALPAGLSLNGSTGVISGAPTTAGTTSVTATVHSADGGSSPTTFNWVVNPSALFLGISGPTLITAKGTYTFTANPSGFTNPTFAWSERFCADSVGSGCSAWQNTFVTGTILTRVLNKDCSGTGTNTYWTQVTAHNFDGRTVTAQLITALCHGEPL